MDEDWTSYSYSLLIPEMDLSHTEIKLSLYNGKRNKITDNHLY